MRSDNLQFDLNAPPAPKSKFKPKIPPRKQKATAAKVEQTETKADLVDRELLAKLNNAKVEDIFGRRRNIDRKSAPVEVAFGQRSASTIRKFGDRMGAVAGSNPEDHAAIESYSQLKEYIEPWDYENSNYPISLPLRLPHSGDPEILDKEEFGRDTKNEESVKHATKEERNDIVSSAVELGLMDAYKDGELFFFQLPEVLPFIKQPSAAAVDPKSNNNVENAKTAANLKDLPSGRLGKMMVYRSGKIKMKIGNTLFDVSPGQQCMFAQDAAVISTKEKKCCIIRNITKKVVVTPDVDALLDSMKSI